MKQGSTGQGKGRNAKLGDISIPPIHVTENLTCIDKWKNRLFDGTFALQLRHEVIGLFGRVNNGLATCGHERSGIACHH